MPFAIKYTQDPDANPLWFIGNVEDSLMPAWTYDPNWARKYEDRNDAANDMAEMVMRFLNAGLPMLQSKLDRSNFEEKFTVGTLESLWVEQGGKL
ncbi:MAG TPA: hypothetical protein VF077_00485 [Nitrospiraceae bacterium]